MPPSARSKQPARAACRAGEGALLVAEQLALQHALGERLAVHRDERPGDAIAPVVQQARDQLLAGAALALDQHRGAARRDAADELEQLAAARALGDHGVGRVAAGQLLAQLAVLARRGGSARGRAPPARAARRCRTAWRRSRRRRRASRRTADGTLPCAVSRMTGSSGRAARSRRSSSMPSMSGMLAGRSPRRRRRAPRPPPARPRRWRTVRSRSRRAPAPWRPPPPCAARRRRSRSARPWGRFTRRRRPGATGRRAPLPLLNWPALAHILGTDGRDSRQPSGAIESCADDAMDGIRVALRAFDRCEASLRSAQGETVARAVAGVCRSGAQTSETTRRKERP